ncbi:hypothetical protein [Desulfosediminicola ganghwensis]|uniref:hypothetical protein n=1 Tax=Desulfosediminicola ganghwensis TaxID=2569540 RepID=UPI0010AB6573|nr:hypothetical protein [Desulfosediminicola ganghwensis]
MDLAKNEIENNPNNLFPDKSDYVFPAVIMYFSSFEAYMNENLAFSRWLAESDGKYHNPSAIPTIDALREMHAPYRKFKDKVKGFYKVYDKDQNGINTDSELYQSIIALNDLRNSLIHFCPEMIEDTQWPDRIKQAFSKSKPKSEENTHWVVIFSCINVGDWAHDTIKEAIVKFVEISGAMNPFDPSEGGYWEKKNFSQ